MGPHDGPSGSRPGPGGPRDVGEAAQRLGRYGRQDGHGPAGPTEPELPVRLPGVRLRPHAAQRLRR
ncbi:hypothetical protein C0036_05525 [Streptomyces sp. DJ]|nr:hypothetical protein C0036_05525 [Streptomyces sp. DJ]